MEGAIAALVTGGLLIALFVLLFESSNLRVTLWKPIGSSVLSGEPGWLSVSARANYGVADTDYDSVIETAFLLYDRLAALKGSS